MKTFLMIALSALTLGMFGTDAANADWMTRFHGKPDAAPQRAATAKKYTSNRTRAASRTSTKRTATRTQRSRKVASSSKRSTKRSYVSTRTKTRAAALTGLSAGRSSGAVLSGLASFYWQPQPLASGGRFNPEALTAAHKTLPFGTRVQVTNLNNGKSVQVVINDRGPYIRGRIIDLSRRAAHVVGMQNAGVVPVRVTVLGR